MRHSSPHVRESRNILFVESGILGFGIWNPALGIRNPTEDWNPESNLLKNHSRLDWATRSKEKRSMESLACSKRSDSGGRCRVKKAMKSRGGLGRAWNRLWKASPGYMPQRDDIQCNIGISGVKTIVHELHMKGQGHGQRENPCLWAADRVTKFGVFEGIQRSLFKVQIGLLWIASTSGYVWFSVVYSLRWTLKNQKRLDLA